MLRALKVAHEAIIKKAPPESVFMAGTTTILGIENLSTIFSLNLFDF